MQRPAKPSTPVRSRPPPPVFQEKRRVRFFCLCDCSYAQRPSGEIGRHSGLKIRRLPERGRTGSIPVSGTNTLYHPISNHLATRMFAEHRGFFAVSSHVTRSQEIPTDYGYFCWYF